MGRNFEFGWERLIFRLILFVWNIAFGVRR